MVTIYVYGDCIVSIGLLHAKLDMYIFVSRTRSEFITVILANLMLSFQFTVKYIYLMNDFVETMIKMYFLC